MKKTQSISIAGALVLCLLGALSLSGCIEGRADVTYGPKGPPAGHSTLKQIKTGQTSKEWLLGVLGEPSTQAHTPEGIEVLTYEYTKKVDSDVEVFLFLDMKDKREERTVYVFELENGIVTNYWKE